MTTDITYCTGVRCPFRDHCSRYIGHDLFGREPDGVYIDPPLIANEDGTFTCEIMKPMPK